MVLNMGGLQIKPSGLKSGLSSSHQPFFFVFFLGNVQKTSCLCLRVTEAWVGNMCHTSLNSDCYIVEPRCNIILHHHLSLHLSHIYHNLCPQPHLISIRHCSWTHQSTQVLP